MVAMNTNNTTNNNNSHNQNHKIIIPERAIDGGLSFKFESDPYKLKLHNLISVQDFTDSITKINHTLKPSRPSKTIDGILLASGPLLLPLAVWSMRHFSQVKCRKRLLLIAIQDFNATHPHLYMRWNRKPDSCLTVEWRNLDVHGPAPPVLDSDVLESVNVVGSSFEVN